MHDNHRTTSTLLGLCLTLLSACRDLPSDPPIGLSDDPPSAITNVILE